MMQKFFFYIFAVNVLVGLVAAFIWLSDLIGPFGFLIATIYTGAVLNGANSLSDANGK